MTLNQDFFDASLRHQIDLLRFGNGVAKRVNAILDATRADLRKQVEKRLSKVTGITSASLKRLRQLESAIDRIRSPAWNDVSAEWERTAIEVALEEPIVIAGNLTRVVPVELDLVQPSPATLRALATRRPLQGKYLREWAQSIQASDRARIQQQIRIGMVQGEGARDIASRVFGDRGAMSITRHQAEAVTRTVINAVSNAAQREFLSENSDLFDVEQYVATLDARTTPICRSLDGKRFPIGKGPVPPQHVACRSLRVAALDGEVIGERPFTAGTEKQMLREYASQNGLGTLGSSKDLPRGHKTKYDKFKRRRMRELTGQVPANTTYQQWLSGQSHEFQDDILGPTRARLFRDGGLKLDRFVSRDGDELTLEQLYQRNRKAWEQAGVPPPRRAEPDAPGTPTPPAAPPLVATLTQHPATPAATRAAIDGALAQAATHQVPRLTILPSTGRSNGDYAPSTGEIRVATDRRPYRDPLPQSPRPGALWSISSTAQTPEDAARLTTLHELGHHAHMHGVWRWRPRQGRWTASAGHQEAGDRADRIVTDLWQGRRGGPLEYLTDYAGHGQDTPDDYRPAEYFAEAHAAYHAYPDWLRRVAPRAYAAVEEVIRIRREVK